MKDLRHFKMTEDHVKHGNVPLFEEFIKENFKIKKFSAYHLCGLGNYQKIIDIENSSKNYSVCCFSNIPCNLLKEGIHAGTGIIFDLSGEVLAASNHDMLSMPDEYGRRWIDPSFFSYDMATQIKKIKPPEGILINRRIIVTYLNRIFNLLIENKNQVEKELFNYFFGFSHREYNPKKQWNEIILTNIKINKIFILSDLIDEQITTNKKVDYLTSEDFVSRFCYE